LRVVAIEFRDLNGRTVSAAHAGEDVDVYLFFENHAPAISRPTLFVSIYVKSELDVPIFMHTNMITGESFPAELPESGAFVCRLKGLPLPEASFRLGYEIGSSPIGGIILDGLESAVEFHIEGGDFFGSGQLPSIHNGVALVAGTWHCQTAEKPRLVPALTA
jgi:hypothetical protein